MRLVFLQFVILQHREDDVLTNIYYTLLCECPVKMITALVTVCKANISKKDRHKTTVGYKLKSGSSLNLPVRLPDKLAD